MKHPLFLRLKFSDEYIEVPIKIRNIKNSRAHFHQSNGSEFDMRVFINQEVPLVLDNERAEKVRELPKWKSWPKLKIVDKADGYETESIAFGATSDFQEVAPNQFVFKSMDVLADGDIRMTRDRNRNFVITKEFFSWNLRSIALYVCRRVSLEKTMSERLSELSVIARKRDVIAQFLPTHLVDMIIDHLLVTQASSD